MTSLSKSGLVVPSREIIRPKWNPRYGYELPPLPDVGRMPPLECAVAFINGDAQQTAVGANPVTTEAKDITGATLVVVIGSVTQGNAIAVSDSQGNTPFLGLTLRNGATVRGQLWYFINPSTSATYTVTVSGSGGGTPFAACAYAAFSGTHASSPFDQENGSTTGATGNITPSEDNCLVIAGAAQSGGTISTQSGLATLLYAVGEAGSAWGVSLAYTIQTTAAAAGCTFSNGTSYASCIASFKAAAAGGATFPGYISPFGWR